VRGLVSLAIGLLVFVGLAAALVPGGTRIVVLPAAVVAALMLVALVLVQLFRRDEEPDADRHPDPTPEDR
jgi:hypothetical protein